MLRICKYAFADIRYEWTYTHTHTNFMHAVDSLIRIIVYVWTFQAARYLN